MGIRTWTRLAGNSFGAAVIVAAAQLGIGYGLHIVDWGQRFDVGNDDAWFGLLTWTAFITAAAVIAGAAAGGPGISRPSRRVSVPARLTAAVAASLGAMAAVPLAWLPARVARPENVANPGLSVLIAAAAGAAVGLLLALAALTAATVAGGLAAALTWVWAGALTAAVAAATHGDPLGHPRLGLIEVPRLLPSTAWWFGPEMLVGIGVALSATVAAVARRRGLGWLGVVCSGLAGPVLIASAYLIAGPGVGSYQRQPYLAAELGAGAGFAAAALVAMVRPHRRARATGNATGGGTAAAMAGKDAKKAAAGTAKATTAAASTAKATKPAAATKVPAAASATTTAATSTKAGSSPAPAVPATALTTAKNEPGHTSVFQVQLDTLERPGASRGSRGGARDPVKPGRDRKSAAAKVPTAAPAAAAAAATAAASRAAPTAPSQPRTAAAAPSQPAAARAPAEPARRGPLRGGRGRPEPAKPEPVKPEPVKPEPRKPEAARPEPTRQEPAKTELGKRGPARPAPSGSRRGKTEPAKPEPARPDAKSAKPDNGKPDTAKPEPTKPKAKRGKPTPKARAARVRGRQALRQHDLDHINWVRELVRTPDSPDLGPN